MVNYSLLVMESAEMMKVATGEGFPLRQSADEGSKMGSHGYRRLQWWKLCFVVPLDVFGVRRDI